MKKIIIIKALNEQFSINLQINENIDQIKPEEIKIKINSNKIKKKKNIKFRSCSSNKISFNLKNKEFLTKNNDK